MSLSSLYYYPSQCPYGENAKHIGKQVKEDIFEK